MRGEFVAEWPGWCPGCRTGIREGDVCRHNDEDQVVHVECLSVLSPPRVPVAVCSRCNLTRPCEHDD